jgi:C-terminal processing protease CtpA/Prc
MSKKSTIGLIAGIIGVLVITMGLYWYLHRPKPKAKPSLIVAGVGLYLGRNQETRKFEVRKVFANSPAEKSGIAPGLILNKVGDVLAETKNIKELSALLMGPVGSKVTVEMMDSNGVTSVVELTREKFVNKSAPAAQ